jgi:hypothetical protein
MIQWSEEIFHHYDRTLKTEYIQRKSNDLKMHYKYQSGMKIVNTTYLRSYNNHYCL